MNFRDRLPALLIGGFILLGAAIFGGKFITSDQKDQRVEVKVPEFTPAAARGQKAFADNCASCHGETADGTEQGPPLVHSIYNPGHHADQAFVMAAMRGVRRHHWSFGNMPPQPQVSPNAMKDIIRFVRELQQANGIAYKAHNM